MPRIAQLSNCSIYIYADDHMPPHFHVVGAGWEVQVSLETLSITAGKGPRKSIKEALQWASDNKERLTNDWTEINERD
jgi:hypothetical protein